MLYSWDRIGKRIRECGEKRFFTQETLSEEIERLTGQSLNRQTVGGWENGKPIKKIEQILAMCELFGCDSGYLLCEHDSLYAETASVSEITGLSPEAVDSLIHQKKLFVDGNARCCEVLSDIILSDEILFLLDKAIFANYEISKEAKLKIIDDTSNENCEFGDFLLEPDSLHNIDLFNLQRAIISFAESSRKEKLPDTTFDTTLNQNR